MIEVAPHQVFVFGTNVAGFHGAGDAGWAWRGERKNTWRNDEKFLTALGSERGSPLRVGLRAILGQAKGMMHGSVGMGYGIVTIMKPGWKLSIPLSEIRAQIAELAAYAAARPALEFVMGEIGCGFAGYSCDEIKTFIINKVEQPPNIILPEAFK